MIERFQGQSGLRQLRDCLLKQKLVANNLPLAEEILSKYELFKFLQGETLVSQGSSDQKIYFIVSGSVDVFVNQRKIAQRYRDEHIGEMALINPGEKRSATIVAREETIVVVLEYDRFLDITEKFQEIWKRLACVLSERLSQRSNFHAVPNNVPRVFIASSSEALPVAEKILSLIRSDEINAEVWKSDDLFELSQTSIESLLKTADECDFAIIIVSNDDKIYSRGAEIMGPRDNVIFEMGLFMGAIGRDRTLILRTHEQTKTPSDVFGLTVKIANFSKESELSNACSLFKKAILDKGPK